jgi:preprotein translocase subunit SecE
MSDKFDEELEPELQEETAEERKAAKADKAEAKTGDKKKVRKKSRVARWFREMRSELKKVVWPTPKQIVNNTAISLVVMAASAVVIWGIDQVGAQIFGAFIKLGG